MRLYIKQRVFSWTDSYDVYDETGEARYEVKAEFFSLGHQIHVYDKRTGAEVGTIQEKLFTLLPQFEIIVGGQALGTVRKEFSLLRPKYQVDYRGWEIQGDLMCWDYRVMSGVLEIMSIRKEFFHWSDSYVLEYDNPAHELQGLMLVIAIDAANCKQDK